MANLKSAQQHILINKRNRKKNLAQRAAVKAWFKKLRTMQNKEVKVLDQMLKEIYSLLDKVSYQAYHPNKVNHLKSLANRQIKEAKLALG